MARDHYVAQTYLRWFGDPAQDFLMHGYMKSPLKDFPCRPINVCREWDGDLNPDFIAHRPELRGDFRTLCEPHWNEAVDNLLQGRLSNDDRLVIAFMASTLMTCTPTWRRVAVDTYNSFVKGTVLADYDLAAKAGQRSRFETEAVDMLRHGKLVVATEPKFIEAKMTRGLLSHARLIYDQPWTVLANVTDFPFVTSDNPFAIRLTDPRAGITRYLPITPAVCLEIPFAIDVGGDPPDPLAAVDLDRPPKGEVRFAAARPVTARAINRLVVQNAENLVLTTTPDAGIQALVEKYAKWGVEQQFVEQPVPGENAVYQGTIVHVRERGPAKITG